MPRNLKALATVQEQEPDLKKQFAFKLEPLELRMYRLNPNNKKIKTYLKLSALLRGVCPYNKVKMDCLIGLCQEARGKRNPYVIMPFLLYLMV